MAFLQRFLRSDGVIKHWYLLYREPFHVPVGLRNENHWARALHVNSNGRQRIPVHQVNKWSLFYGNLLDAVEALLALLWIGCGRLCTHELVDLRFPRCLGSFLRGIPLVIL